MKNIISAANLDMMTPRINDINILEIKNIIKELEACEVESLTHEEKYNIIFFLIKLSRIEEIKKEKMIIKKISEMENGGKRIENEELTVEIMTKVISSAINSCKTVQEYFIRNI